MIGVCEVCETELDEATALEVVGANDVILYVCSDRCLEEFEENPELYRDDLDEDQERRTA
jgi:YHS domain-containing protein